MNSVLLPLFAALILAYILSEIAKKFSIPRVVGQIVAGMILSALSFKSVFFNEGHQEVFSFLANLGIILLFYYAGLEVKFSAFTKSLRKSISISLLNSFFPLALGFAAMYFFFDASFLVSLIVGICLAMSAQTVSVDVLEELKLLKSRLGNTIISTGAVDDVIELLMITALLSLLHVTTSDVTFTRLIFDLLFFVILVIVARIFIVPYALRFFNREHSSTARFTGALVILLLMAALGDLLKVGSLIGALVAGMITRQTIYKDRRIPNWEEKDIANSLHIIAFGFLIPFFFVWIGLNTHVAFILPSLGFIVILAILSTVGTVGGTALAVLFNGGTLREGLILGWGLNPKGDIELVIALLALNAGIISLQIFTALSLVSLITAVISPMMLKYMLSKEKGLLRMIY